MNFKSLKILLVLVFLGSSVIGCNERSAVSGTGPGVADRNVYLSEICNELSKKWPDNRAVNIVCHGHSVPAGYFVTPVVDTFNAYPHLFHKALKEKYPNAVINVIVTAIGGENSISGAKRFEADILNLNPDVLLIDYALNDRPVGLDKSSKAWSSMIEAAKAENVKILLLTGTIDLNHIAGDVKEPLNQHSEQIRSLAAEYNVGLVDSLAAFDAELKKGVKNSELLSNGWNHPNRRGHELVVDEIIKWFY
jgi:lysophospholipase L1-like esterase